MKLQPLLAAIFSLVLTLLAGAQNLSPLRPGDTIGITLKKPAENAAEFSTGYTLDKKGCIKLRHLKKPLKSSGLSIVDLARAVEKAYSDAGVLKDPVFSTGLVPVAKLVGSIVTVSGEVKTPKGDIPRRRGLRLYQAIMAAGGLTEFADAKWVKLLRGNKGTLYDLRKLLPDGSNNPVLKDGDYIHVPQK